MSITFSSAWYNFNSKHPTKVYEMWIHNMLSNVNNYNLVIYSDLNSCEIFKKYLENPNIKLVIKPMEEFYNYKYKDYWVNNHEKNPYLTKHGVPWEINMLWAEKTSFVKETFERKYFETDFYGWCDIGYFRNREILDLPSEKLEYWPSREKLSMFDLNKVHYACPISNPSELGHLEKIVKDKNHIGLPKIPIPPEQVSIAGGFFLLYKNKIEWWRETFDAKLRLYFENEYLVKDDQMIILDCVFSDVGSNFKLYYENACPLDSWFQFQRILL